MKKSNKESSPVAIFMMGGPGSGKGFVRKKDLSEYPVLDCDEIKKTLRDYDPKNPMAVHQESREILARRFFKALAWNESFVYDGTGSNAEKYLRLIRQAKEAGFKTKIVYVKCPLNVALERNANRERTVAEAIVREKHETIEESFELVSPHVEKVVIVDNG